MFRAMMIPLIGIGVNVRVAVDVDVPLGSTQRGRHFHQIDSMKCRDVSRTSIHDLPVAGTIQEGRYPELEIHSRGHKQIGVAENRHEAGLGLNEVGVLVSLRDRGDRALVADDLSRNGAIGRQARDDLGRRGGGDRGAAGQHRVRSNRPARMNSDVNVIVYSFKMVLS